MSFDFTDYRQSIISKVVVLSRFSSKITRSLHLGLEKKSASSSLFSTYFRCSRKMGQTKIAISNCEEAGRSKRSRNHEASKISKILTALIDDNAAQLAGYGGYYIQILMMASFSKSLITSAAFSNLYNSS